MPTSFSELNETLSAQLTERIGMLRDLGVSWLGLGSSPETFEHIKDRHFSRSEVPGSKFNSDLSDEAIQFVVGTGELMIVEGLIKEIQGGATAAPGLRIEAGKDFSKSVGNIGTDMLITRDEHKGGLVTNRIPGNERAGRVYLAMLDPYDDLPETSAATFIGGIYPQDEGKGLTAGFYTLFPGQLAPPMSDTAFWDKHGFLATNDEIFALRGAMEGQKEHQEDVAALGRMLEGMEAQFTGRPFDYRAMGAWVNEQIQSFISRKLDQDLDPFYSGRVEETYQDLIMHVLRCRPDADQYDTNVLLMQFFQHDNESDQRHLMKTGRIRAPLITEKNITHRSNGLTRNGVRYLWRDHPLLSVFTRYNSSDEANDEYTIQDSSYALRDLCRECVSLAIKATKYINERDPDLLQQFRERKGGDITIRFYNAVQEAYEAVQEKPSQEASCSMDSSPVAQPKKRDAVTEAKEAPPPAVSIVEPRPQSVPKPQPSVRLGDTEAIQRLVDSADVTVAFKGPC